MISQEMDGDLLIITGTADADRAEIEASVKAALERRQRVNVFRRAAGLTHLIAAMVPTGAGIHVRGPSGRSFDRSPRDAAWRGRSRFTADLWAATDDRRPRPPQGRAGAI